MTKLAKKHFPDTLPKTLKRRLNQIMGCSSYGVRELCQQLDRSLCSHRPETAPSTKAPNLPIQTDALLQEALDLVSQELQSHLKYLNQKQGPSEEVLSFINKLSKTLATLEQVAHKRIDRTLKGKNISEKETNLTPLSPEQIKDILHRLYGGNV